MDYFFLIATASPSPQPGGAADPNANDYNGATWVVLAVVVVAVIIAAGTYYLIRSRRINLTQLPDDDKDLGS